MLGIDNVTGLDVVCEELQKEDVRQIVALENSYKAEIGEPPLSSEQKDSLGDAINNRNIRFFVVKQSTKIIAMCSVSRIFSTFSCKGCGIFEDFYIKPDFRKKGYARMLTQYVRNICTGEGIMSLWVGCSQYDLEMYRSLGFSIPLGNLLAWNSD